MTAMTTMTTTTTAPTSLVDEAGVLLASIREQQSSQPLSIINRSEPILEAQQQQKRTSSQLSTAASERSTEDAATVPCTASSLTLDLSHYRDLFSKLRFSYLEQVSKEKYLRSIVGDPPVLVSASDNALLEEKLAGMKQELKAKKEANAQLVTEMEEIARAVAKKYDEVNAGLTTLETVPRDIVLLQAQVDRLKQQVAEKRTLLGSDGSPNQNMMTFADTEAALKEFKVQNAELDREIDRLQRQIPAKDRECQKAERELELLERQRNEVTTQATDARRIRAQGGRDYVGDKGKWYVAQDTVVRGLLGIDQTATAE